MFSEKYPNLEHWIESQGWIELGSDENSDSWIRIMDTGGLCYEDSDSLDEALEKAELWAAEENEE